ncbi:peptide-methionine (S)-S-oxide reductase MsrA [Methyloceanibacter sp.]|jgi:peptide-methionine (S)-S-oxide reductase|uniref:peptide-methionine (S)-S-oxide reductase MsrA n=1 Tax=Methyloceanibacter sp. TaxID=1965321 RepID=UPI00346B645A
MNKKLQTIGWVGLFALTAALLLALSGLAISKPGAEESRVIPAPALDEQAKPDSREEVAVLAGGCFWGVQGVFQHLKGVRNAVSGYAGGNKQTARYDMVGLGNTGHAEAVRITYDPKEISYGRLLQIYFSVAHNPTELNRQGPDIGTQYRSAIFPMDDEQAKIAKAYIGELNRARAFDAAIVTKIEPDQAFYPAENYHQDFMVLNPNYPYIVIHDRPKLESLKRLFPDLYRAEPVLVSAQASN